ncbi:DUF1289 domain-containing protein [Chitinimonas sp. BJB300]
MFPSRLVSPCINRCRLLEAEQICAGCGRTLDEVAHWGRWGSASREVVWLRLEAYWQDRQEPLPWLEKKI